MERRRSRVQFLRACAVIGAALAIGASGCSKVSTNAAGPAPSAANARPGVLRIGEIFDPATLNPELASDQTPVDLSMLWSGYLFNWSDDNQWIPELATEVPSVENGGVSKDGLTITYHLRQGVKWQDGAPFGADDVIFSWNAVMNPANNITSRLGYDLIAAIDKKDDHTIVVHLKRSYAPFIASFFTMSGTPYSIMPKHILGALPNINRAPYNSLPVGTGPFKVVEWRKGSIIRFEANPNYWRGPPKLKAIEYNIIPSDDTILLQLRTGELDMEYAASQSQLPALRDIPGMRVILNPFTAFAMFAYNLKNPILSDVRVRQALAYGTDRQTIINKAAHGAPIPADSDQPNFLWAYNPDVPRYPYDQARARSLLDAAGWKIGTDGFRYKNGRKLELVAVSPSGSNINDVVFGIVQQDWKAIGVDLSEKQVSAALLSENYYQGGVLQTGKFDVVFYSWINGVDPDDSVFTMCDQWPPAGQNIDFYCNPKLDAAERIALRTYPQSQRKLQYDEIQRLLATDQPFLVIWFNRRVNVVSTRLTGFKPAHAVTEFWNPWEWSI